MSRCLALFAALLVAAAAQADNGLSLPATERVVLDNGTILILNEKHDVPLIGIEAVVRGGAVADPADKQGLGRLYANLIKRGAGDRDGAELADAIDSVGGNIEIEVGLEATYFSFDFLARDTDLMVGILADVLRRPALERREFLFVRNRTIEFLRSSKDANPLALMPVYGRAFLFGRHPYGNALGGDETSLATITHRDIRDYLEQQMGGDRLIIAVSGDFDAAEMRERLTAVFGDWRAAGAALPEISAPPRAPGGRVFLIDKPGSSQTYFWLCSNGVSKNYARRAHLDIVDLLFGGRFTSMLNTALRIDSGLTYGAASNVFQTAQPGYVSIASYTATDTTIEAIDLTLQTLDRLHGDALDDELVASGRNYLLGLFPMSFETAAQLAAAFAELELYGLDAEFVEGYLADVSTVDAVSAAEVAAEVFPTADELTYIILGDADAIRDAIRKYGSVTEISITEPRFRP